MAPLRGSGGVALVWGPSFCRWFALRRFPGHGHGLPQGRAGVAGLALQLAAEALGLMTEKKITQLFVVTEGDAKHLSKPVGVIHIHDCLRAGIA